MRKLLFFSRVAFICNICFLISLILHFMPQISNSGLSSTIIIMGRMLALLLSTLVIISYIIIALTVRKIFVHIPAWLVITNFIFFVVQVIFLMK